MKNVEVFENTENQRSQKKKKEKAKIRESENF